MLDHEFRQFIESVKLRAPIEEVVRERVPELKRQGALWVACCPFHEEKTPSFKVDPRRGTWHCFGACSTGGDAIRFVERFENVAFREAVEALAQRAGLEVPRWVNRGADESGLAPLFDIAQRAAAAYERCLNSPGGARARDYLAGRGLESATCEAFGVGWAPGEGRILSGRATGAVADALQKVGLARRRDDGSLYDFFRGRITIPIRDRRGRVVGFGARVLPSDEERGPKYVNTPDTPLFHKGRLIFGYDRALDAVRRTRHLVLVEGYTDVMAAHQVGLNHVVAVLGTATTDEHAALVRRSGARRVTLLFDGDEAGRRATLRALRGLLRLDVELDVAPLPAGVDPCDLCVQQGPDAFRTLLDDPRDWFDFALEPLAALPPAEQSRAADELFDLVGELARPIHRDGLLVRMAEFLGLAASGVREQYTERVRRRRPGADRQAPAPVAPPRPADAPARRVAPRSSRRAVADLLGACFVDNSLVPLAMPVLESCAADDGYPESLRELCGAVVALYADEEDDAPIDASRLLAALDEGAGRDLVVTIEERGRMADSATVLAADAVQHFEQISARKDIGERASALTGDVNDPQQQSLLRELFRQMTAG